MKIAYRIQTKEELEEIYMHVIIEMVQRRVGMTRDAEDEAVRSGGGILSHLRHKSEVALRGGLGLSGDKRPRRGQGT
ncbi:hypothetical protein E2C01_102489 [Portunus trituberculatus]|uniref:Uncharacterized protein n=1 Tax=Portunus trituberculatus TaxID=210409 RepID=A0A5B7KPB1_PORTR|nr:hypothetical protein [Portunus trituberculatus]